MRARPAAAAGADRPRLRALGRELPRNLLLALAFNAALAVFLTAALPGTRFGENLVYSQCIGLALWLLIDGTRVALWPGRAPPALPLALIVTVALPVGYLAGRSLAHALLGGGAHARITVHWPSVAVTIAASIVATFFLAARARAARLAQDAAESRARNAALEQQAAEARFRLLAAQVEPHFLFNTLANLRALIETDPPRAVVMLDHLDGYLRASLSAAREPSVTLAAELERLEDYCSIVAMRMGRRLAWRLDLPAELAQARVPPMLLQPLVENAIRHGIEPKAEGGEVAVAASARGDALVIEVTDTGVGPDAVENPGTGVGVRSVRERIAASYGSGASLVLAARASGGTCVTLVLPGARP
jgi:signal transduction histidine kinase